MRLLPSHLPCTAVLREPLQVLRHQFYKDLPPYFANEWLIASLPRTTEHHHSDDNRIPSDAWESCQASQPEQGSALEEHRPDLNKTIQSGQESGRRVVSPSQQKNAFAQRGSDRNAEDGCSATF